MPLNQATLANVRKALQQAIPHNPADKLILVLDTNNLKQLEQALQLNEPLLTKLVTLAHYTAQLNPDGYLTIKDRHGTSDERGTYIDLATKIAEWIGADLNDPTCRGLICTCPTRCDCQDYENGLVSNECPIHNTEPYPSLDCPQHGSSILQ